VPNFLPRGATGDTLAGCASLGAMTGAESRLAPEASTNALTDEDSALWRLQSDAVVASLIRRWLAPAGCVLKTDVYDEAVSDGLFPVLSSRFDRVLGIDADPDMVASAEHRHPGLEARGADVRALPFERDSVDAVLSNSTLDHLLDRGQVLAALGEIRRVLRPGGELLITLDNRANPLIATRNVLPTQLAQRLRGGFPYETGWACGPRGLRRLLQDSGMRIVHRSAVLHAPRFLVARMEPGGEPGTRLHRVLAFERLERWPSRYLSGHFVAALARTPG
jgi:SAM-dependent methyltransferase